MYPCKLQAFAIQNQNYYLWYMRAHIYLPDYTIEDYNLWEGHWELIEGVPYALTPSGDITHQRVSGEMLYEISSQLKEVDTADEFVALFSLDWVVSNHTVLRPDLIIISNDTEDYIRTPPRLIIELLSKVTARKDRHLKYEIYEEQGVPYYIIIDPETRQFNIFVLTEGKYVERNDTSSFAISSTCAIELHLATVLTGMG